MRFKFYVIHFLQSHILPTLDVKEVHPRPPTYHLQIFFSSNIVYIKYFRRGNNDFDNVVKQNLQSLTFFNNFIDINFIDVKYICVLGYGSSLVENSIHRVLTSYFVIMQKLEATRKLWSVSYDAIRFQLLRVA